MCLDPRAHGNTSKSYQFLFGGTRTTSAPTRMFSAFYPSLQVIVRGFVIFRFYHYKMGNTLLPLYR
jgi:hypothetical protein